MGTDNYIKLYRKCRNNILFLEVPFDKWHAFEFLLIEAKRFPTDIMVKGQIVHLEIGQLLYGIDNLAEKWGWSKNKVYRFLKLLKGEGMISYNGTPSGTVITIENYEVYQCGEDRHGTADGTPNGTADGTHIKKDKERERKKKNGGQDKSINSLTRGDKENPPGECWIRLDDELDFREVF